MNEKLKTSKSVVRYGIRKKLISSFLFLEILIVLIGCMGYYGVYKITLDSEDLGGHWLKASSYLAQVVEDTEDTRRTLALGFAMRADAQARDVYKTQFTSFKLKWENDFSAYEKYTTSAEGKERNKSIKESFNTYITDADNIWGLVEEGRDVEARLLLTEKSSVSFDQLLRDMEDQMAFIAESGEQAVAEAQVTEGFVLKLLILSVVISLIAGTILQIVLGQIISRPLVTVTKVAQCVAEGDLNVQIPKIKNRDEIGALSRAVSEMVDSLRAVIREVLSQAERVAATSQELSAVAEEATASSEQVSETLTQLASGATDQASSVGDTSSVIEQLAASALQVAENAELVNQSSCNAARAAELGANQAENAVEKIEQIREASEQTAEVIFILGDQSKQIGQIVDVIKAIAEQTNLLALNAAIEAARAGELGRGFAVVAEEVRKLAEQSSLSTMQIATLITSIQSETERAVEVMEKGRCEVVAGVEAVNLAGDSFRTIVEEVNTVVEQIRLVTAASQQMAQGTNQAVKSVESIGVISERTAASSEEVAAASEEQTATMVSVSQSSEDLARLGEVLMSAVAKFKV